MNMLSHRPMNRHLEFFAGHGGTGFGLSGNWQTIWANDIDPVKAEAFSLNHRVSMLCKSISDVSANDIPDGDLMSATFPCTNTSAAGDRTGLLGIKSGVVYQWLQRLTERGGAAHYPMAMLENPMGLVSRNQGNDLADLIQRLNALGYAVNLSVVDGKHFVPQSRPRIFISAIARDAAENVYNRITSASLPLHNKELYPNPLQNWMARFANALLLVAPSATPSLPERHLQLVDCLSLDDKNDGSWASEEETKNIIDNLVGPHLERFNKMLCSPHTMVATIARRGRQKADGTRFNAAEISLSGLCPALRPYKGGSSRTWVLVAGQGQYAVKVITPRETARIMGYPDSYQLPKDKKAAYQCTGDSVVPQAVAWVDANILQPVIKAHCSHGDQLGMPL